MKNNKPHSYRFTLAAAAVALLALVLPARGDAGEPLAIVADPRGHVAMARQHTARFDGAALEISARTAKASEPGPTARFQLLEVRQGPTVLTARGAGEVRVNGRRISYLRTAGIVERYDVLEAGVEQSFVLRRRWREGGDLTITGALEADRELGEPLPDGSGGFVIPLGGGEARLRYGAAKAIDAGGDERGAAVAIAGGQVIITVDGGWLAAAEYPVVVDPLISVEANWRYQGRPAAAFDFGGSASIPGATPARHLVAYESDNLGAPLQIWGKLVQWDGTRLPMTGGDPSFDMSLNISNDSAVAHTRPTVAFKFGKIDSPRRNYLVGWQRSDGGLGYRILDRGGSPLMAAAKIAGERFQDVTAATAPQGGWNVSRCGTTIGCTPYLLAYRAWTAGATAGPLASVRLSVVDDGTGALVSSSTVEQYAPVDDPIYAPHIAYGHSAAADYFILAYRRPTGEIVARKVTSTGGIGPAYVVASSSNGPPVVAYSAANNRWAVFWRANVSNFLGTFVTLQGQIFTGNPVWEPLAPVGSRVTAVSALLGDFSTPQGVLPDYSAAGTRTATDSFPYQGLFELAYVQNGEVYTVKVYTGGSLGAITQLTSNAKQDRYVKLAVARIDPLTTGLANPLSCVGTPGARCALWVFEHFYSATDHDITGYWTSSEY